MIMFFQKIAKFILIGHTLLNSLNFMGKDTSINKKIYNYNSSRN